MSAFLPDDRALCVTPRIGLKKGALYHVWACSAPERDGSQILFFSEHALAVGDGARSTRFRRVRPSCNRGDAEAFERGHGL